MKRNELVENIRRKGTFLCVGLDPDMRKLPRHLLEGEDPIFEFNKAIIDATAPYCVAFKPNSAFYESQGVAGIEALERTVAYIRANYPDQLIILDAKRGDIGNTARMYAEMAFEHLGADACTVAPYMGYDSVQPFLDYEGKWTVLLALTSNPGSADFQMIRDAAGHEIYQRVIKRAQRWGTPVNLMFVVGATKAEYLEEVRKLAPRNFLLVPGVGAQGGSLGDVCRAGLIDECGLLVNASRSITYASLKEDFAEAAGAAAARMAERMSRILAQHAAGEPITEE